MKTVLITGANRGIGFEHARRYAERGAQVYAAVRSPDHASELKALPGGRIRIFPYDANNAAAAEQLKGALGDTPIDLLFANAGIMNEAKQSFGSVDVDGFLQHVRINALAPLKLAEALADNVARSQRKIIAFQSSHLGSIAKNTGGRYAYRVSKAALNMIAKGVSADLASKGVIAVALHPGWVRTRMGGANAPVSVDECVSGQQRLFDALTPAHSGRFFSYDGQELPW